MITNKKSSEMNAQILMLGYLCVQTLENLPEKVKVLQRFGLTDIEIATICDCAVQSVRDARQKLKKSIKSKK